MPRWIIVVNTPLDRHHGGGINNYRIRHPRETFLGL